MSRYVSLSVILLLLVALGVMFYRLLAPFLLPLFLAAVTAIVAAPLNHWLLRKCRARRAVAAGVTTVILIGSVLLPTILVTTVAATQLKGFVQRFLSQEEVEKQVAWRQLVEPGLESLAVWFPNYPAEKMERDLTDSVRSFADRIAGSTLAMASSTMGALAGYVVATMVYLVSVFFFLQDGPQLVAAVRELIPVEVTPQERMVNEFNKVTRAVVTATLLAASVQALLTALALQVLGFGHFIVFLVITMIAALVPLVGASMVWVPFVIILAMDGQYISAIGLTLYGWLVIGLADNAVRMYILNSDAQLHPLLALVSVMGALEVMGLWGIFIGPIVASCFTAAVRIANQELKSLMQERRPGEAITPPVIDPPGAV